MISAERTLVKSPPEVWQVVDDHDCMRAWMASLLDIDAEVHVAAREPESRLAWGPSRQEGPRIELRIAKKGWGTHVRIGADSGDGAEATEAALEGLLDDLAEPQKRPFARR